MRQLALPFVETTEFSPADFLDSPANAEARCWLARPAEWPGGRLALWGEAGVGKSHLMHIWARRVGAVVVTGPSLAAPTTSLTTALALDDADLAPAEATLLHLLNAAAEAGRTLLMAGRAPPSRWKVRLPDLASRLTATAAVEVGAPEGALLAVLFARLLSARQLVLAPALEAWLLAQLPRHPSALAEAVARLDRAGLASGRPVGRRLALVALDPLLAQEQAAEDDGSATVSLPQRPLL